MISVMIKNVTNTLTDNANIVMTILTNIIIIVFFMVSPPLTHCKIKINSYRYYLYEVKHEFIAEFLLVEMSDTHLYHLTAK